MQQDFFGEDAEFVDEEDEHIIRAIEWLMLVPGLFDQTVKFVIRAHTYFLSELIIKCSA
jgi:nuclear pore complex protein Nup107